MAFFAPCSLAAQVSEEPNQEAASPTLVVVRTEPGDEALGAAMTDAVVAALEARGTSAGPPPPAEPERESSERAALEAAELAYSQLRPEQARSELEAALSRVEARGGVGWTRGELLEALLLLAMSRAALADATGVDLAIDRALTIDPGLAPDPVRYPPTLRARVEERRQARAAMPMVPLRVELVPRAASVEIDGAPMTDATHAFELAPGMHFVRARHPRHRSVARTVSLESPLTITLQLPLDVLGVLGSPGASGGSVDPALALASAALGRELLIVDAIRDGATLLLEVREGAQRISMTISSESSVEQAAEHLVAALGMDRASEESSFDPVPWLIGIGAAVAAVGIATAIGFAAANSGSAPGFEARGSIDR